MVTVSSEFSEEEIGNMTNCLSDVKKIESSENKVYPNIDTQLLNSLQRKAYNIVESHFRNPQEQLLMIITSLAGSGKSFIIDALRDLLKEYCIVTAFVCIAAFNVKGKTLHSLLYEMVILLRMTGI